MSSGYSLIGLSRATDAAPPDVIPVALGPIVAWIHALDPQAPLTEERHDALALAVHLAVGGMVPLRSGVRIPDEAALRFWVSAHEPVILPALAAVAGRSEFRVTLAGRAPPSPDAPVPSRGGAEVQAARLKQRQARHRALDRSHGLAAETWGCLVILAGHESDVRPLPHPPDRASPILRCRLLMPTGSAATLKRQIDRRLADADLPACTTDLTGPHAPVGFVPAVLERFVLESGR